MQTDDARIASNVVSVMPEIPGKMVEWRVKEGDMVASGDVLGRQDLGSALSSGRSIRRDSAPSRACSPTRP